MKEIKAYLKISVSEEHVLEAIVKALEPEVKFKPSTERGEAKLHYNRRDNTVILELVARDLNALRAMVNAYLYLLHVATNTIDAARRRIGLG